MRKKLHILLAEDEPAILRGLISCITSLSDHYVIDAAVYNGADALEKTDYYKPDLVITDIRMPILDGLDYIEAASKVSPHTAFIILSGYTEFEYAKRALSLNVTDYLLKPVDPEALEVILATLQERTEKQNQKTILDYLTKNLYPDTVHSNNETPLSGCVLYLMFIFYGTVTTNMYNELTVGSQMALERKDTLLLEKASKYNLDLFILHGNHLNETILAIVSYDGEESSVSRFIEESFAGTLTDDIFTNCFVSNPIPNGENISDNVRNCYLYAALHIVFGQSQLFYPGVGEPEPQTMVVTPVIKELVITLKAAMEPKAIEQLCCLMTEHWSSHSVTQFQIQIDLRYFLNLFTHKTGCQDISTAPTELLSMSSSYQELLENIQLEMKRLCQIPPEHTEQQNYSRKLAAEVKEYLDKNYTTSITYKDFNDIFSYHEKYIGLVFKEEYHISPNRYITKLRLTAAKNMMRQNPNQLLKDIASAVGYNDQLYFSRVFKNNEGISPKVFLKSLSEASKESETVTEKEYN